MCTAGDRRLATRWMMAIVEFPSKRCGSRKTARWPERFGAGLQAEVSLQAGVRIAVFGKLDQRAESMIECGIVGMPGFPDVCGGRTIGMCVLNGTGDRTGLQ